MGVDINELTLDITRKVIDIEIDGKIENIHIFNVLEENRVEVVNKLEKIQEMDITSEEMIEEMYRYLYHQFTDLQLGGNIVSAINNPKMEMLQVRREMDAILDEIQYEYQLDYLNQLNQIRNAKLYELNLKKLVEIEELEKELNSEDD
ncbi:MAG: hypothetical protein KIC98_04205 [Clostridioides difficile]|nr:hypothetical protein [Clostridioides sp.]MBS5787090.1 hypothetical protein [Clostridioides difficile]